jgi:hypothetical protein
MPKKALLCLISLLCFSCKEKVDTAYSTDALDCISALIANDTGSDLKSAVNILKQYKKKYKFAADLEEKMLDKTVINNAEKLALQGNLSKANALLNKRLIIRGFSEELNKSQEIIAVIMTIKSYKKNSFGLSLAELSREFAKIKFRSEKHFKAIPAYESWITKQQELLTKKVSDDKKMLLRSLAFTADYTALYKPQLLEIILLETASLEKSNLIPGVKDLTTKKILTRLQDQGLSDSQDLISTSTSNRSPGTLVAKFNLTRQYAKAGKVSMVLTSLQELQKLGVLPETYRKEVLKTLFLAIGWNNTSLINRSFVDLSVLLETVYKINQ